MAMTIDSSRIGSFPMYEESRKRMHALNAAAANYLGMGRRELRTALESGKSLADLATERGKDVEGLRKAMMAADPGTSGNGGINATGLVDRVINAHRGPVPRSGPAVDPVQPRGGEEANHTLPIQQPRSDASLTTQPMQEPRSGSTYHTLPIQQPKAESPYHTLPIEMPVAESPYHTTGGVKGYI